MDILGDGPLGERTKSLVNEYGVQKSVHFHGHVKNPYPIVAAADVMVLPSLSEGLPRAALEALHLGVPCVLRHADGNIELIQPGLNGLLFEKDSELFEKMIQAAELSRSRLGKSLLPGKFRQENSAKSYFELVSGLHD